MALTTAAPLPSVADGSQPRAHIAALDGLRGLAVIAVLFFHAGKLQGGFLGVDLFFALSGFLITSLLLAEVNTRGRVDVVRFWGRRFRRLLPAVLVFRKPRPGMIGTLKPSLGVAENVLPSSSTTQT